MAAAMKFTAQLALVIASSALMGWAACDIWHQNHPSPRSAYVCCLIREGTQVYPMTYVPDEDGRFGDSFPRSAAFVCQVSSKPCPSVEAEP